MIENVRHIGPALYVQGGISSVLASYKTLFSLPQKNFIASYNGSFVKSLPMLFLVCIKLILCPEKGVAFYQIHTSADGSFFRKFLVSLCLRLRHKKYLAHIHGSRFQEFCSTSPSIVQKALRSYLRHAEMVVCITPDMQEFLDGFVGKGVCRFTVVPNPCDTLADAPVNLNREGPVKVLFAGRYGHRKGVYDLMDAFRRASFNVPVQLHLFGDGEVEKVKSLADTYNAEIVDREMKIFVSDWLSRADYLKTIPQYDLLALPSYAETFGMSLVEAMGQGLPVISTFSGGVPFVVRDGVDGFLIKAGDVSALAEKLSLLVNDRALRVQMGRAGWERAKNCFSGKVVLDKLENLYTGLKAK